MKHFLNLIILVILVHPSFGQNNNYPQCKYTYYKSSKKISTSICYDNDNRWGKAIAYKSNGEVIYEKQLRKVGGHSSVNFSYHPNGAVAKAEWSSAPDGGIQWYKSLHEFSETGELINQREWSHDMHTTIPQLNRNKPGEIDSIGVNPNEEEEEEESIEQEVMECAEIYVSEFWLINNTKHSLIIQSEHKLLHDEKYDGIIAPGDSIKGGQQIQAEFYENPISSYTLVIRKKKKRKAGTFTILPAKNSEVLVKKALKRYYFEIY